MATREHDIRVEILNTLLTTPHRALEKVWPVHQELIGKDPRFYVRLAAWYADNGDVRDHKEMFIVNLVLSDFPGHRDVGLAMLRGLPPYQVVRVVDFISGRKKTRKVRKGEEKKALAQASKRARQGIARKLFGTDKSATTEPLAKPSTITEEIGLFRNIGRIRCGGQAQFIQGVHAVRLDVIADDFELLLQEIPGDVAAHGSQTDNANRRAHEKSP